MQKDPSGAFKMGNAINDHAFHKNFKRNAGYNPISN